MYSIVIADDEQLERMVLRQTLDDYLGERCKILVAANGREAVEAAIRSKADLAIMDIEMPGMKGLEAARSIAQRLPRCKIIILTAYSEFEYAREAISFGSVDYLLKPCADRDLHRALDSALRQIDSLRAEEAQRERSTERIKALSSQIEEQIVRIVMGGHISPAYIIGQMADYGISFSNGVFAILYGGNSFGIRDTASALKSCPWPEHIHPFLYCYDGKVYMVNVSNNDAVDCLDVTARQLKSLCDTAITLWGSPLFGAIGKSFSNIQYAQLSCFQALVASARCSEGHPISIYEEGEAEPSEFADNPIINSVLFGDIDEIDRVAHSLINSLFAQRIGSEAILNRLNDYLSRTVNSLRSQTGAAIPDIVISVPGRVDTDTLKGIVSSRLRHMSERILAHGEIKDANHLQKVKREIEKYVAGHFREDIFLPGIARQMNYSSAYFSKLFKQCFARNFITYLTDIRIEAAKELIKSTDLTIKEIGENVGYKDPNYFPKVFRKVVGASPSEYRAICSGGHEAMRTGEL